MLLVPSIAVLGGRTCVAFAESGGVVDVGGSIVGGKPTVIVAQGGDGSTVSTASVAAGGTGREVLCDYLPVGVVRENSRPVTPEAGKMYMLVCKYSDEVYAFWWDIIVYDPSNPFGAMMAAERAMQVALAQLEVPDPVLHSNPPESGELLVGMPTWFFVGSWGAVSVSATLAGVTATVTASPRSLEIDTGDGASLACEGPGRAWSPDLGDSARSECSHVYERRSTDGHTGRGDSYRATATVGYDVSWSATNGQGGPLDPLTRAAGVDLRVTEAQAVIH